ncbi:hypothetical protein CWC28_21560, partial [Pseudoalteromonas sp. S4492]|uniref:hypothetical protein n=1 Tax=Pseudoalteromonas sp. S4492 TaxID=579560 RepID=UPI00127DBB00
IELLNSNDATIYSADWRAEKIRESRKGLSENQEKEQKVAAAKAHLKALEQQIAEQELAEKPQQDQSKQKQQTSESVANAAEKESSPVPSDFDPFDLDEDWGDDESDGFETPP